MKKQAKFKIGDTVFIPKEDPKANTIWSVNKIGKKFIYLYHPIQGNLIVYPEEIQTSPY
jgi:hypothetical protein